MSCRIARWSQDHTHMDLASCCACGSADLEVCSTAHNLGPHLCSICTQSKADRDLRSFATSHSTARESCAA